MPYSLIGKLEGEAAWAEIGPTAGLVVALAAGVVGEAARHSTEAWEDSPGVIAQASALRARALRLAREDLQAHLAASDALGVALEGAGRKGADGSLAVALTRAADLPLEIAEVAADTAELGALVAENGSPDLRADATGAVFLAAGAVGAASHLIGVNLSTGPDDERLVRAGELRFVADAAIDRARAAGV